MVWVDVAGYEGKYQVNEIGQVRSIIRATPLILKQYIRNRYPSVTFGDGRNFDVHCLVAAAFLGPRPAGMYVCHADDNPLNSHASNLRYDTPVENTRDAYRSGRHWNVRRPANSQAKLTQS